MFKKLKEKITEEVKISPTQRFQQLTQSVTDRLQNSTTSDENFFSIGDDDSNMSSGSIEPGFSSVSLTSPGAEPHRRLSNASIASDVSFLPRYESMAQAYHLQSDLDISASEMEDNASTSSQLGHLTKEQIYSAFQKSQMRYHKYRGRYTDLAKHYKDMERELGKMKAVLVDTQDKAIRRVTELKEQCSLEQRAKAHLEGALRDELDEKQFKIESLETKIGLLQNGGALEPPPPPIENLTKYLGDARQEIEVLTSRLQESKANAIISQTREQDFKTKIAQLEREIAAFAEREKENNLSLAQNKMDLHNEMLSKDAEIESLKRSLEAFETKKMENLQIQNQKLIDKLETATKQCDEHKNDAVKMEGLRLEIVNLQRELKESHAQIGAVRKQCDQYRDDATKGAELRIEIANLQQQLKQSHAHLEEVRSDARSSLLSLESKVRAKMEEEFSSKEVELRDKYARKFNEVASNAGDLQEIQLSLVEKDDLIKRLGEEIAQRSKELGEKKIRYEELEANHLELIEEGAGLRSKIVAMEKEELAKIGRLEAALEEEEKRGVRIKEENDALEKRIKELGQGDLEGGKIVEDENTICQALEKEKILLGEKIVCLEEEKSALGVTNQELVETIAFLQAESGAFEVHCKVLEDDKHTLEELIRDMEEKLQQLDVVKKEKLALGGKNTKLEELVLELQEERVVYDLRCVVLEDEKNSLGELVKTLEESLKIVQEDKTALEESLKLLQGEKAALEKTIEILGDEKQSLLDAHEARFNTLEQTHTKALTSMTQKTGELEQEGEKNHNHLQTQLREKDQQITKLHTSLKELQIKSNMAEIEMAKSRALDDKIQELEAEKKILQQSLNAKDQETMKMVATLKDREDRIKDLHEKSEGAALDATQINLLETKVHQLEADKEEELSTKNHEILKRDATIKELQDKIKILIEQNESIALGETQIKLLEEKIRQLEVERNDLLNHQTQMATRHAHLEAELQTSHAHTEAELTQLALLKESHAHLKAELQASHAHSEAERNQLVLLKESHAHSEVELQASHAHREAELKESHAQLEAERTDAIISKMVQQIDALKAEQGAELTEILAHLPALNNHKGEPVQRIVAALNHLHAERDAHKAQIRQLQMVENNQQLMEEDKTRLMREIEDLRERIREISTVKDALEQNAARSRDTESDVIRIKAELEATGAEAARLRQSLADLETRNCQIVSDSKYLSEENQTLQLRNEELRLQIEEAESVQSHASAHKREVDTLERHITELNHEKQLLIDELQELKVAPLNASNELEMLREKLTQFKSLDLTNKTAIAFFENEVQKLKNQNEKLSTQLDETLVTLNHCAEISSSTEIEYLKNVLYNYMMGKEGVVLARVIAAVCKFDAEQTETVLAKERQKQSLLRQLGII